MFDEAFSNRHSLPEFWCWLCLISTTANPADYRYVILSSQYRHVLFFRNKQWSCFKVQVSFVGNAKMLGLAFRNFTRIPCLSSEPIREKKSSWLKASSATLLSWLQPFHSWGFIWHFHILQKQQYFFFMQSAMCSSLCQMHRFY